MRGYIGSLEHLAILYSFRRGCECCGVAEFAVWRHVHYCYVITGSGITAVE